MTQIFEFKEKMKMPRSSTAILPNDFDMKANTNMERIEEFDEQLKGSEPSGSAHASVSDGSIPAQNELVAPQDLILNEIRKV